jgi:ParB family transcriptional regulator, chromosome partitioning protein
MPLSVKNQLPTNPHQTDLKTIALRPSQIDESHFSRSVYGDQSDKISDLMPSIREQGILVPLAVARGPIGNRWELLSGHRRLACARVLDLPFVSCQVHQLASGPARHQAILDYNRQRHKTFSQMMREADAFEDLWKVEANKRRRSNLRHHRPGVEEWSPSLDRRNSDDRGTHDLPAKRGRTDTAIASHLGIGSKDTYRQARAIWKQALTGDIRATASISQLDHGTKTIHAAYKDLRRRNRFATDFQPTPYDVWSFRHDRAFGIPHPGSIPPAIVAHALHYFTTPNALVVDPMAGGGTTLDVCQSMGRRCLGYDLHPTRADIQQHDIRVGFPPQTLDCDLIFCDPPYHSMLAQQYAPDSIASASFSDWIAFLHQLTQNAFHVLQPGGRLLLLLAPQTEKDLPAGFGYLDHAFFGYIAAVQAGFLPERRISCPMDGAYHPQQVRRARTDARLLGQVRDLLVMKKPTESFTKHSIEIPYTK